MKILITGVAGFIGSNLAEKFLQENRNSEEKYRILGIDNLVCGVREQIPKEVEFHKLDIRSKEIYPLFKGIDYVFHLAAKNCINDCQNDPLETANVNVGGTVNVFEAARKARVKKIIYAESSAMYEGSNIFPTPESNIKPESFYAISKLCSMHFAKAYEEFYGLKFTALRYFCVYGPRQDYRRTIPPVMSAFIMRLLEGKPPVIYGTGDKRRDFVYVDDVNNFHLLCIKDFRTDGRVFNIGTGKNYSINEIYAMISEILSIRMPPVFKPDLQGEAVVTLADIKEAMKLGWKPKIDIREGLNRMVGWIKQKAPIK